MSAEMTEVHIQGLGYLAETIGTWRRGRAIERPVYRYRIGDGSNRYAMPKRASGGPACRRVRPQDVEHIYLRDDSDRAPMEAVASYLARQHTVAS